MESSSEVMEKLSAFEPRFSSQDKEVPSPVLQGPDSAPQHPLAATAGVAVGVEEGHRGAALPGPAGIPPPLQPQAHGQDQQDEDDEQQHAEKHQGEQQLPQQPETQEKHNHVESDGIKTESDANFRIEADCVIAKEGIIPKTSACALPKA